LWGSSSATRIGITEKRWVTSKPADANGTVFVAGVCGSSCSVTSQRRRCLSLLAAIHSTKCEATNELGEHRPSPYRPPKRGNGIPDGDEWARTKQNRRSTTALGRVLGQDTRTIEWPSSMNGRWTVDGGRWTVDGGRVTSSISLLLSLSLSLSLSLTVAQQQHTHSSPVPCTRERERERAS
jgi:hypothetical protein